MGKPSDGRNTGEHRDGEAGKNDIPIEYIALRRTDHYIRLFTTSKYISCCMGYLRQAFMPWRARMGILGPSLVQISIYTLPRRP